MENETVKKLVNQWRQLYILIHKRQDLERIELPAIRAMAHYLSAFTGVPINKKMNSTLFKFWMVMYLYILAQKEMF